MNKKNFLTTSLASVAVLGAVFFASQTSVVNNVRDDEIGFYKGMTFKNKQELTNSLKIAGLKKDFGMKKVINSRNVFFFKCSYPDCIWWLRAVKFTSNDRFAIRIYEKYHTCGSEHLTSHNPHATVVQSILQAIIPTPRQNS